MQSSQPLNDWWPLYVCVCVRVCVCVCVLVTMSWRWTPRSTRFSTTLTTSSAKSLCGRSQRRSNLATPAPNIPAIRQCQCTASIPPSHPLVICLSLPSTHPLPVSSHAPDADAGVMTWHMRRVDITCSDCWCVYLQGSHASGKSWIFFLENSRTWKVLENHFGPGKSFLQIKA